MPSHLTLSRASTPELAANEAVCADFYENEAGLAVPYYRRAPGTPVGSYQAGTLEHLRVGEWPSDRDVEEKIKEIAMNRRVLEYGGDTFDVSSVTDNDPKKPYMIHMSTYGSSLDNPGNAWEFAVQCLLYPEYNHVYAASFGNGASSPIPQRYGQSDYVAATGRLTYETPDDEVVPIEIVRNLFRALTTEKMDVIRVMGADSAGVSTSRALAMAMDPGQLESAVFSGATGFRNMSTLGIAAAMVVKEQIFNARQNAEVGAKYDPAGMTADKVATARRIMDEYTPAETKQAIQRNKVGFTAMLGSRLVTAHGLRRGPTVESNSLLYETNAMNRRHASKQKSRPGPAVCYIMGENDPLYGGAEQCVARGQHLVAEVDESGADLAVVVVPEMTHAFHTALPQLKHGIARAALTQLSQAAR